MPSWRRGLRKNPSTSMVHEKMKENEDELLPRSASSPRLALDHRNETVSECQLQKVGVGIVRGSWVGCKSFFRVMSAVVSLRELQLQEVFVGRFILKHIFLGCVDFCMRYSVLKAVRFPDFVSVLDLKS